MGQYWIPVNLDKREFIYPHKLGSGLKLWEQLAAEGVGRALVILTAAQREQRGGGDLDLESNWHGPERTFPKHNGTPSPMPKDYQKVAARTIGRWAGDRIAIIGDYAENSDLPARFVAKKIYWKCRAETKEVFNDNPKGARYRDGVRGSATYGKYCHYVETKPAVFTDITEDVCAVIEHELQGKFQGAGWREFVPNPTDAVARASEYSCDNWRIL